MTCRNCTVQTLNGEQGADCRACYAGRTCIENATGTSGTSIIEMAAISRYRRYSLCASTTAGIAAHPPVQFVPFRILLRRNAGRHANVSLERGHIDARIGRRIPSEGFAARQQVLDQIGLHMLLLAQIGP
jgi:hypothetical protein